jgi:hypothetical protein
MNQQLHDRMYHTGDKLADDVISHISTHSILQVNKILRGLILTNEVKDLLDEQTKSVKAKHLEPSISTSAAPEMGKRLLRYLDESGRLPTWADPDLFAQSEEVFAEHGMVAFSILGCAGLPEAYVTSYGARVLAITQQLETHVRRRLYETSLFVLSVMSTTGLTQKGQDRVEENGIGIRVTQKVRLMHAAIRHLILQAPDDAGVSDTNRELGDVLIQLNWPKTFGIPINQIAMSVAILSFSYITLRSLRKLGVRLAPSQERAYLHRWNVVGHIMGILPELLLEQPETMEAAEELYDALWKPAAVGSREGRMLEKALLDYMEGFIPENLGFLRRIPRILTRELIGAKMTRLLGVQLGFADNVGLQALKTLTGMYRWGRQIVDVTGMNVDWADNAAVQMLRGSFGLRHLTTESIDELTPARIAAEWLFRVMVQELAHMQRGGDRTPFTIRDELANKWHLQE